MRMIFFPAVFSTDSVAAAAAEIDSFGERLLGCRDTGETLAGVFAASDKKRPSRTNQTWRRNERGRRKATEKKRDATGATVFVSRRRARWSNADADCVPRTKLRWNVSRRPPTTTTTPTPVR